MIYTDGIHLISDVSVEDLHNFAKFIGLKRCWFHRQSRWPHYDIPKKRRHEIPMRPDVMTVSSRDLVKILRGTIMREKKLTKTIERPFRPPDHHSKRGVAYWWAPEWVREVGSNKAIGRIKPIKERGTVNLYSVSKDGNLTYIQGSIQDEFKKWHEDRQIDYILLGVDPDHDMKADWED